MLYSVNTEFSEKVLRAMKKHWLTKQHTEQKKEGSVGANPKFQIQTEQGLQSKPSQETWLVVYYASLNVLNY